MVWFIYGNVNLANPNIDENVMDDSQVQMFLGTSDIFITL